MCFGVETSISVFAMKKAGINCVKKGFAGVISDLSLSEASNDGYVCVRQPIYLKANL